MALASSRPGPDDRPELGLFTSLPILWNEADGVAQQLASPGPPHWAKLALERRYRPSALDTLDRLRLPHRLLIAQPRPLSPAENVALDSWLRGGGRLLLFVDPALTWDSAFAPGDRRRPQDIALLSPILARWGLQLLFDETRVPGEHSVQPGAIPVNLPGELTLRQGGFDAHCAIAANGLVARCRIGRGRALIVADAAMLEPADDTAARVAALGALLEEAFAD
ncbi:Gldg family protein [Novosphingobium lentum]|uniref:Gldg family protein n=1 Tax=Novosphingobium lentum TaxID=145287 RepID=UPI00082A70A4|nr:hypothetical protein [Novosphingobium lentum]